MKIKSSTPFAYGTTRTSRRPPQPEMTLVVRGKFLIKPGGILAVPEGIPVVAQGSLTGDLFEDDDDERTGECLYSSDLADFKPHGEVLLRGTCHVPNGKPVTECPVRFAVGAWSKILRVVGPRTWSTGVLGDRPSAPTPFTRMPLGYKSSFGGPGYALNPVGKGYGTTELPTVEGPREPIGSRSDKPAPAGFGPLSPYWPPRMAKMQSAGKKRQGGKGSPFFGEDFDWTYFNAAPPDQRLSGYLRGDEELVFQNLHPDIQVLTTRLPGIRVRAFVKDVEGRFREVVMNLDTLFADLDKEVVYLTWRGLDAVKELDLLDVQTVLFASEEMSAAPLPREHYREALEAFERDPKRLDEVLSADQRREVDRAMALAKSAKDRAPAEGEDPLSFALDEKRGPLDPTTRRHLDGSLDEVYAANARQGISLDEHIQRASRAARASGVKPGAGLKGALASVAERLASLRREAAASGKGSTPELLAYEKLLQDPRLAALGLTAGGEPKRPEEPGPGRDLSGDDLSGQDLSGRDLTGANLERAILTKANLEGARLGGARLKNAVLSEANLAGADLSGADLTEALLVSARAPGANLTGATLTRTIFQKTDLTGATLVDAKGESPVFSEATLQGANARRARFRKPVANRANLEGVDFSESELGEGVFSSSNLKKSNFTGATLERMSFFGSDLSLAVLLEARGEQTAWIQADLTEADFSYAVLPGALWNQAKAARARFFGADLRKGKFYRAILDQAEMVRANLFEASLDRASIAGTRFIDANLYDAKLIGARGAGYDLTGANLKMAVLEIDNARG